MTTYWFKPKRYGYGAAPMSWQGWALTGAFTFLVLLGVAALAWFELGPTAVVAVCVLIGIAALALVYVSWRKTDGVWQWRWGDND